MLKEVICHKMSALKMILDSFDNESVLLRCVTINVPPFKYIGNNSMLVGFKIYRYSTICLYNNVLICDTYPCFFNLLFNLETRNITRTLLNDMLFCTVKTTLTFTVSNNFHTHRNLPNYFKFFCEVQKYAS